MWLAGSSRVWDLYLGVSAGGVALGARNPSWIEFDDVLDGAAALMRLAVAARRSRLRPVIRLWLSGALARPFLVDPIDGLKASTERQAMAAALAVQATGLTGPCAVWCDKVPRQQATLAVAVEARLLEALGSTARAQGVRLTSVRPWWTTALELAQNDRPHVEFLAVEDSDALTVLAATRDNVWLSADGLVPKPDATQITALLARRQMAASATSHGATVLRMTRDAAIWHGCWPAAERIVEAGRP